MKRLISPRQVAQAIGVSESSLKRWCDQGLITTARTAGGHRRLDMDQVVQFLRQTGHSLVRPELLGLPATTGQGGTVIERAREQIREALLAGDEDQCRRIIFDLHLAGRPIAEICDRVLAGAFHDIGQSWSCGEAEVYQERRGCEICVRALAELRSVIPPPADDAPLAMGGTPECDPYQLPTTMVELVLRQAGWRAQSLGSRLPFSTLLAAILHARPRVFWLSVSHVDDEQGFVDAYQLFYRQVPAEVAVVVGGRALTEPMRRQMQYAAFCDQLQHLEVFLRTQSHAVVLNPSRDERP